ncbi:integrase, catalytic region, zinc finger, CCHC-type containing protein [Tanacetum coccineum]
MARYALTQKRTDLLMGHVSVDRMKRRTDSHCLSELLDRSDAYDAGAVDDILNAKAVLMANLSNYGYDVISEAAFWLQTSHPKTDQSTSSLVKIETPRELLKTLKDIFNVFDKDLLNEVTEVQTVFNQMEAAVQQYFVDKQCFEIHKKELFLENDRLLQKIMSQDVMICVMNSIAVFDDVNVEMQSSESCVKCVDLDAELLNKQNAYNDLSKSYSQLEKHCISLELTMQLNQEIFQKDSLINNQNALEILEYFENNNLKAQLQAKDTTICKLKEHIKTMRENDKEEKVKHEMDEIETINIELEHSVAKLLYENERLHKEIEHLKKIYKDQFDSIKKTRAISKEHGDSLIAQLNTKSIENADLKQQLQDKVFVITSLKNDLRKLKGKETVENAAQIPIATTVAPGMFKLDLDPLAPRLLQNREAHIYYLKHTQEQADILRGIVKQTKAKQPLDNALDLSCKHAKLIQVLLVYVRDTYPNAIKLSEKKVAITPMNKVKKVRFSEPLTSSSNIKQVESSKTSDSNTPVLSSTGLKCSTSTCRSQPTGNKKNDKILQKPSSNRKNKVEAQPRKVNKKELCCPDCTLVSRLRMLKTYDRESLSAHELWLGHNLFSVGQFCDADLEVAFRKNTCFIQNLEGVDLLLGSRDINLYTISLDDIIKTSLICLLSKSSKTKSWLWHRQLSHLNFGTLNKLAKDDL